MTQEGSTTARERNHRVFAWLAEKGKEDNRYIILNPIPWENDKLRDFCCAFAAQSKEEAETKWRQQIAYYVSRGLLDASWADCEVIWCKVKRAVR